MKTETKKTLLSTTPSAVLAILTFFGATIVLFGIGEGLGELLKTDMDISFVAYIIYDLVIIICCYFIVKENPGSIWYVPVICNLKGIIPAFAEPGFWITPIWIPVCIGWVLSIIASIIGVRTARKMMQNN